MAITFSIERSESNYLDGFNNNVVVFTSDAIPGGENIKSCNINIGSKDFVITPDSSDVLEFDFIEIVNVLIKNRLTDNVTFALPDEYSDSDLVNSYVITFTITFTDNTTEQTTKTYKFLRSVSQINASFKVREDGLVLGKKTITAFLGFPFDIGYLNNGGGNYTMINTTNGKVIDFTGGFDGTRIVFGNKLVGLSEFSIRVKDDGGILENNCYENEHDFLKIGINEVTIFDDNGSVQDLTIELLDVCEGVYLKFFNEQGSWSYWLFNRIYRESKTVKVKDKYRVDFGNLEDTKATVLVTKKESEKRFRIHTTNLTQDNRAQLIDVLDSDRVELYNKTADTFQTVIVRSGTFRVINTKKTLSNLTINIDINEY